MTVVQFGCALWKHHSRALHGPLSIYSSGLGVYLLVAFTLGG